MRLALFVCLLATSGCGRLRYAPSTTMDSTTPVQVLGPTNAIQLSATDAPDFSCALYADHVVRCWGDNGAGGFGIGAATSGEPVPVEMLPPT